ncbi:ATP phosphoribosyltransferase regulatory subunit [Advenella mimigardefordensis]|uniref:ATP phosphoribosyltransferase regulatory subunit n=1 Tax=Advenella mimigardefordensis (strain DSM 17166 / LMG 22922 / DPN7) TaxID=1247726 RepID=W0PAK5_ADVMD|nr:ATP phosphoribosyltransferase regulatory subunit [Advenella mimigardefordensis]AHG63879.1 ATP phosphoribosyltransferase regulatory subunit [Advenella mimigardefordensis DPN7]
MTTSNWLLPEHLSDILPAEARRIEELRRAMLDLYRNCGFELVAPPLVEYTDSLFVGNSQDLKLQTNKLVDQLSGRTMGVRADMTSQVARIDAHLLNREGVARLCYCGSVLHARPSGLLADRELLQIGAEIYGYSGYEADLQIIQLALDSLALAGVQNTSLDLNHPGVSRALIEAAGLQEQAGEVLSLLKEKDVPGLRQLFEATTGVPDDIAAALIRLPSLYGDGNVLTEAASALPDLPGIRAALQALRTLVDALDATSVGIDLADVKGYDYHSGVSFAIFGRGWPDAIVRGGRYDNAGSSFGRARAATGFSLDLRKVSAGLAPAEPSRAVRAPWNSDPALGEKVRQLRQDGNVVVQFFPGTTQSIDEFVFDRELVSDNGQWVLKSTN